MINENADRRGEKVSQKYTFSENNEFSPDLRPDREIWFTSISGSWIWLSSDSWRAILDSSKDPQIVRLCQNVKCFKITIIYMLLPLEEIIVQCFSLNYNTYNTGFGLVLGQQLLGREWNLWHFSSSCSQVRRSFSEMQVSLVLRTLAPRESMFAPAVGAVVYFLRGEVVVSIMQNTSQGTEWSHAAS